MVPAQQRAPRGVPDVRIQRVNTLEELPPTVSREALGAFLHESLKPYEDPLPIVLDGIDYALAGETTCGGGFVLLAPDDDGLLGALVMLNTHMRGYVPENLLLFVAVSPDSRGRGIGGALVRRAIEECNGDVRLHVEHDNPARRLYERCGFVSKYTDMRCTGERDNN